MSFVDEVAGSRSSTASSTGNEARRRRVPVR